MTNRRPINRDTGFLLPPSVDKWLPQRHLARFVGEVGNRLDLSALEKAYPGSGSASYRPAMLLSLLIYSCATGVFSSQALERASYDSVAVGFIAGHGRPDHDTIANFRKRFLGQIEPLFVEVLKLARAMGMLKLGTVALDGTKVHANTSRNSALSYGHASKLEKQLRRELQQLFKRAEAADGVNTTDGMSMPAWIERREQWLAAIDEAKAKIELRVAQREQEEYQAKLAAREEQAKRTGKKPRGRPPEPPSGGVAAKEQINLTHEDLRIMPVAGGDFDQCYNAHDVVATENVLIIAHDVVQAAHDKQQLAPMLGRLTILPRQLGRVRRLLADAGCASEANVEHCEEARIEPPIALGRERHHTGWRCRFAPAPKIPPPTAAALEGMRHRLKAPSGRRLYALRKQTPEPVFGSIKSVLGFRQFLLRGLPNVRPEWNLVSMALT